MTHESTEKIRTRVLRLIDSEFESDAAFERVMALSPKTVNNWRRGRSSSFMQMLPRIAKVFALTVGEVMNLPINEAGEDLSDDEREILNLYREASILPIGAKDTLKESLKTIIRLYIDSTRA